MTPLSRRRLTKTRRGVSLPELLIALVVLGIIGAASVRVLVSQTRYYDVQLKKRSARSVSRASVNLMLSELRMMESAAGVEAASSTSITLRVPYAMGMVCGTIAAGSVVALLPADSTVLANATPSGHAWRNASGVYTYTNSAVSASTGDDAVCAAGNISTVPNGRIVTMTPAVPVSAAVGDAVFLYQRVRYEFASSGVLSGRRALWRTIVDSDTREEIAAPFDSDARFRFFQFDRDTSDVSADVADIRGIELLLDGASQSPRAGRSAPESTPLRTAVFFNNRLN
jgi:prepilin-type N-terminal cleavage/methylation domain-containing protein